MQAVVAVTLIVAGASACARVPGVYVFESDNVVAASGQQAFNPVSYVNSIWSAKVLPTVRTQAVPASTLLPALAANATAASARYGHQAGINGQYAFLISGSGTVTAVGTTQPTGPVTVTIGSGAQAVTVQIATGPVFAGTALRDALTFIDFNDFTNQIDYANVATQLNDKVRGTVVNGLDRASLPGKQVSFAGAFTLLPGATPLVVPTELKVGS